MCGYVRVHGQFLVFILLSNLELNLDKPTPITSSSKMSYITFKLNLMRTWALKRP